MKNLKVHFVGYFLQKSDKSKLIDTFDCKEKFFLESAKNNRTFYSENASYQKNVTYFPEILYKTKGIKKHASSYKKMEIDSLVKKIYKIDYQHYKAAKKNRIKFSKMKMVIFILMYHMTQQNKKRKTPLYLKVINTIIETYKLTNPDNRKDPLIKKKIKAYKFRLEFMTGYRYVNNLLNERHYTNNDVYILWGKSYSSRILLIEHLKQRQIPFYIAEYGELPGTASISPNGIFGEVFTKESWDSLSQQEINTQEIEDTEDLLRKISQEQISTRNYGKNMYFLMKYFYDNTVRIKNGKKVVYVNGAELFSSGLFNNRWNINNQGGNPNKMLLQKVVSYFQDKGYFILFKEHPMMMNQSPNARIKPSDFPTVNFLTKSMNIHDILELADIVVSFPSKVVITSLLYQKPTFVLGDFTIRKSIPSIAYFTSRDFYDISQLEENSTEYNKKVFVGFVARLIKYTLIVYDDNVHKNFNKDREQIKLSKILTTRDKGV